MSRKYAPVEFADAAQIDPRRLNRNIQALRDREADLLAMRWSRFQLVLPMNYATDTRDPGDYSYRWQLPFEYEIESVYLSHHGDANVTSVELEVGNPISLVVAGNGDGSRVSGSQSAGFLVPASTSVEAQLNVTASATPWDLQGAVAIVNCKVDAMRDIDGTFTDLSKYTTRDTLTASEVNTLFTDHAANMAKLVADPSVASSPKANYSLMVVLEQDGVIIAADSEYQYLHAQLSDWYLDRVDCYAWVDPSVTVDWSIYDNTGIIDSENDFAGAGAGPHLISASITGLGTNGTDDPPYRLRFESTGVVYRVWAVCHFVARS